MTTNLLVIANVKQLRTCGSFRILLPFFRTSWDVGVLNSAIFNSFHIRVEFGTIWRPSEFFGGGGGLNPPKPPPSSPLGTSLLSSNRYRQDITSLMGWCERLRLYTLYFLTCLKPNLAETDLLTTMEHVHIGDYVRLNTVILITLRHNLLDTRTVFHV